MRNYGILENYESLGTGIVEFALDDYASTVKSLCTYYKKLERALNAEKAVKHHQRVGDICRDIYDRIINLNDIERFLHSDWVQHLTTVDTEYVFRELKKRLKEKGYKVNIMGLIVSTDDNGVKIYANEKEGPNGTFMAYSLGINSKNQNGDWVNGYIQCRFKKGVSVANKTKIKINKSFFVATKGGDKSYTHLMITDFDILDPGETAAQDADEFMKIPDGVEDEVPFL